MNKGKKMLVLNLVLMAAMLGSAPLSTKPEVSPQQNITPQVISTPSSPVANNLCAHALFPVQVGANWTYANTSDSIGNSTLTNTITDVRPDGFTISSQDGTAGATQNWACTTGGLVALSTGGGAPSPDLSIQGLSPADLTVSNPTGVTLPATIQPNMQWPYGFDVAGTFVLPGNITVTASGTLSTVMQAEGMETITVPAGTFSAQKIQTNSTLHLTANYHGIGLPLTASANATFWLAPGVGWIRSVETGQFAGTTYNSTTELQSYNLLQ